MVENQTIGANRISEMKRGISVRQQVHQFAIVGCCNHHMGIGAVGTGYQFQQHCLTGGDPLHRIRAAKQFVQEKQVGRGVTARLHELEKRLDLCDVIALAAQQVIRSAYATADVVHRGLVRRREARIQRLRQHGGYADGPQKRRFARHVGAGHDDAPARA